MFFFIGSRTTIFYTTISLTLIPCVYVFICGGHHDSDRMAVLVMVSQAESVVGPIVNIILYNKYYVYLPTISFLQAKIQKPVWI